MSMAPQLRYAAHEAQGAATRTRKLRDYLHNLDRFEGDGEISDRLKRAAEELEMVMLMLDARAISLEVEPYGGAVVAV